MNPLPPLKSAPTTALGAPTALRSTHSLFNPLLRSPPILLAFQMTVSNEHDANKINLDMVDKMVAGVRDIKKHLVVVTPRGCGQR